MSNSEKADRKARKEAKRLAKIRDIQAQRDLARDVWIANLSRDGRPRI